MRSFFINFVRNNLTLPKSTKCIRPTKGNLPEVIIWSKKVKEELPFPIVHYSRTFISFSETENSEQFFCSCSRPAINNFLKLGNPFLKNSYRDKLITAVLSIRFFPEKIAGESLTNPPEKVLKYRNKICHRCNMSTPSIRWTSAMYGSQFKQYYGWYINQNMLKAGIRLSHVELNIPYLDTCPDELKALIDTINKLNSERNALFERSENLLGGMPNYDEETYEKSRELDKINSKNKRELNKIIENVTRKEFGFRKIGEGFISESILFKIVEKLYPDDNMIRHHRPDWLKGLELDIFNSEKRFGVEYQGQQHFHPVKVWGGKKALKELQSRDAQKRVICADNNVTLIEVDYTEPLEEKYIKNKIENLMSNT